MSGFEHEGLVITVILGARSTIVAWSGESDSRDPSGALDPYLTELARSLKGQKVIIEFKGLKYMNSATVTPIMKFVKELSAITEDVRVQYAENLQWQATSFRAMRVVAKRWGNVVVDGSDRSRGPSTMG